MSDGSSKTLMVDERQTVREVLDKLFEKTHCDCSIDWSLCETNPELQISEMNTHIHIICRQYSKKKSSTEAGDTVAHMFSSLQREALRTMNT